MGYSKPPCILWGPLDLPEHDDPKASPVVYLEGVQNTKSCRVPHHGTHTPLAIRAVLGGGGTKWRWKAGRPHLIFETQMILGRCWGEESTGPFSISLPGCSVAVGGHCFSITVTGFRIKKPRINVADEPVAGLLGCQE